MKKRIIAIAVSLLVFSGAGVYAAQNVTAARPVPTASVAVKSTKSAASGAVNNSAAVKAQVKTSVSSCPTQKTSNTAVRKTSCDSQAKAATQSSAASQKNSCSAGSASQTASQAAKACTWNSNCANIKVLCPALSGGSQCGSGYNCYQDLLNCLNGNTCGQSSQGSSKPTSSVPSSSSKPASSSSTPASSASGSYASFQNQVVQLVNQERTSRGLKALAVDSALTNTATLKSQDMAKLGYFDHTSPTYGSPFDMMKQFGISYRTAGENIAWGQTSPSQVMQGWMDSEGHRANILNSSYTKIGVGIAKNSSGRYYWTQQFIG